MISKSLSDEKELLSEVLSRYEDDPLLSTAFFPKQIEFIESVLFDNNDSFWYLGGNRGGKSHTGAAAGSFLARFGDPNLAIQDRVPLSGWVVAADSNVMTETIQTKYFNNGYCNPSEPAPFIPDREIEYWDKKKQILKLKSGALIMYKVESAQNISFAGAAKAWIHLDEPPKETTYDECSMRAGKTRLRLFCTATILPEKGRGKHWIFRRIINNKDANAKIINACVYDNPYVSQSEIKRMEAVNPPGSLMRRIRLNGELIPGSMGSRVYSAFDKKLHVKKLEAPVSTIPLAWIWDFNLEPMITLVGQVLNGKFHVYNELVLMEGSIAEMVEMFKQVYPTHGAELFIYGDWRGVDREKQTNRSQFDFILSKMQNYPVPIRLKIPACNPFVTDRINAVNRALVDENSEVGVFIDERCIELIRDFQEVEADGTGIRKSNNKSDDYYWRTHYTDAFGYWISYERPIRLKMGNTYHKKIKIKRPVYG